MSVFQRTNLAMLNTYPEMVYFWRIGQILFHGKLLRFMSGPKKQGQIV